MWIRKRGLCFKTKYLRSFQYQHLFSLSRISQKTFFTIGSSMIFQNTTKFRLVAGNQIHAENQNEEEMLYYCFCQTLFMFCMDNVRFLFIKTMQYNKPETVCTYSFRYQCFCRCYYGNNRRIVARRQKSNRAGIDLK